MKTSLFMPAAILAILGGGFAACTPSKEDQPPKPKVIASVPAQAAHATMAVAETAPLAEATPRMMAASLPKIGPAPTWSLQDLSGKTVTSDQFRGKVVVV